MATYRVKKESGNFVTIHKGFIHDNNLSWKAKGLLLYFLSRPDDWQIYETELIKHTSDGLSSLKSGIKELEKTGYIERKRKRDDKGRLKEYEYEVFEQPYHMRNSYVGKTNVGKTYVGKTYVGKSHTTNNNSTYNNLTNIDSTKNNSSSSASTTLVVPFMFMWLTKSKRNKAIGRASVVPTFFGVNEPILFGAPLVLNPVFFIPFIFAPIVNVWIFKFFVDVLKMNSFSIFLPWTTPGPLGIVMGTGFAFWSFVLAIVLIVVDVMIYYPFLKVYDEQILEEERGNKEVNNELKEKVSANFDTKKADAILATAGANEATTTEPAPSDEEVSAKESSNSINEQTNVLVLCAGGGTSGLLANALNKAAEEYQVPVKAAAGGYGAHMDIMKDYQLIILAPQVASNYEDIKQDTDRLGIKLAKTQGVEYINLTRDGKAALDFVQQQFEK
ncbi:lactose/cellobiose-specific phosphotransferase system IIB component [Staphylococcus hominis]